MAFAPMTQARERRAPQKSAMSDASTKHVLLVGPRVAHLAPFFEQRGYRIEAHEAGSGGVEAIEARLRDLVVLELNLSDYSAADFLALARGVQPESRFLLLDDPSRAGQIVKALQAGAHGYVATPPDEARLFEEVERLLLVGKGKDEDSEASEAAMQAAMQVDMLQQEVAGLKVSLEKAESEAKKVAAQQKKTEAELEKAQAALEQAQTVTRKLEAAKDEEPPGPSAEELLELRARAGQADQFEARLALADDEREELEEQVDHLKKELAELKELHAQAATRAAAGDDLEDRIRELEKQAAELPGLRSTVEELEQKRSEAEQATQAARQEADESEARAKTLAEEVERLKAAVDDQKKSAGDASKAAADKSQAAEQRLAEAGKLKADAEAAKKKADEEAKAATAAAKADAEKRAKAAEEAATQKAQAAEAEAARKVAEAETRAKAAEQKAATEAERVRKELEGDIAKAYAARDASEEKYLDREIEAEELLARLREAEAAIEQERQALVDAELAWKKDKLRLVEEKEAAGSADAYRKMEAMVEELTRLRHLKLAYEQRYGALPDGASSTTK